MYSNNNLNLEQHLTNDNKGPSSAEAAVSQRLAAEVALLLSAPEGVVNAWQQRCHDGQRHPDQLAGEIASAAAFGCVAGIVTRNPALLGKSLAPVVLHFVRFGGAALGAASLADIGCRTATPMARTWLAPDALADTKDELGRNLGNAAFDYAINGIACGGGFAAGRKPGPFLEGPRPLPRPFASLCLAEGEMTTQARIDNRATDLHNGILRVQKFDASGLPPVVRLTGNATESKSGSRAQPGDVYIGQREIYSGLAIRFLTQVNVGTSRWINLDLWHHRIHQALHAMNAYHLNERKPFLIELIAQQAGQPANLITGERTAYKPINSTVIPEGYRPIPLPERLTFSGDVYVGALRPLHDAQSVPAAGNIWFKLEDIAQSGTRQKPTRIVPYVSTGQLYHRVWIPELEQVEFASVREAEEICAYLKAGLVEHEGAPLVLRRTAAGYKFVASNR